MVGESVIEVTAVVREVEDSSEEIDGIRKAIVGGEQVDNGGNR